MNDNNSKENNALLDKAIKFAVERHAGQTRKGCNIPYITHPLETMTILNAMRADVNLLAAGVLHDTIEDTNTTPEEISKLFNAEIAALVMAHTEDKNKSWSERKQHTIEELQEASKRLKMLVMADKVSNMRNLYIDYMNIGEKLWKRFNAPKEQQAWYYSNIVDVLADMQVFPDTSEIYWEMVDLYKDIFVTYIYDQSERIIYQFDTNGESYYLQKGDPEWHPFEGKINTQSLIIPRREAERLEDNWYIKYKK